MVSVAIGFDCEGQRSSCAEYQQANHAQVQQDNLRTRYFSLTNGLIPEAKEDAEWKARDCGSLSAPINHCTGSNPCS